MGSIPIPTSYGHKRGPLALTWIRVGTTTGASQSMCKENFMLVKPRVFPVIRSVIDEEGAREWLAYLGVKSYDLPSDQEKINMGAALVQLCAKRCYMSFEVGLNPNITRVRDDLAAFITNILETSHGSVLEHVSYSFALEGVSRVFTAEMNRHRVGTAISEGSMRYIAFQDIPYWIPLSIQNADDDTPYIRLAKERTRNVFEKAFQQAQENYAEMQKIWNYREEVKAFSEKKKLTSMFRRIIPIGVATGGVWTGNLRALRHIFTMRCSPAAEEEICLVASEMLKRMMESEPLIFGDFHLVDGYWTPRYIKV